MYIVNCSWVIKAGWWIIKKFLDEKTVAKMHILGSDYKDELLEHVDAANLPSFLGGACQCKPHGCILQDDGPWKSVFEKFPKEENESDVAYPPFPAKWKVT
jgi:hypothetical protein